jgi:hypothetical protein
MNSHRTLWIVLLVISLVVCSCCAITAAIAGSTINRSVDWKNLRWRDIETLGTGAEVTDQFTRSASVTEPVNLVVEVPVGNITVEAAAGSKVALQATKRAWGWNHSQAERILDAITVDFEQSGNQVRISARGLTGVEDVPRSPQVDITISVPDETAVKLASNVGRILVAGTRADVDIKADVGEVTLRDVAPSRSLQVATRVAAIELGGRLADRATYRLASDIGRIVLNLPPDSSFSIDARSDIGSASVEFPVVEHNSGQGFVGEEVRGDVGANPTTQLYLRSRVGSISVRPNR